LKGPVFDKPQVFLLVKNDFSLTFCLASSFAFFLKFCAQLNVPAIQIQAVAGRDQALVVQRPDNFIHCKNHYPMDKSIACSTFYPLDSNLPSLDSWGQSVKRVCRGGLKISLLPVEMKVGSGLPVLTL